ncbi:NAD-dependent epimerase/dehydratase family protein [Actinophytocola oryzae]|uniref:Nucleoside-diphosphate-sugar epimerase n=1 Tax=Actinophytocola oryzae TaxID=502181 RepID=A0A4R7VAV2_9PSEU|nr:NAD(P)-dependent oxidoreductase [Actinophytocola oryzae]TDV46098.1 nucleoside-diphosphate-sugar epimerase [Actinophytocola oryzae]
MKVLVTGANGTLGTEVVAHLRGLGHDVRAHDRDRGDVRGDLRDASVAAAALDGMDSVVHAAAIPEPVSHPPHETFGNNVESTYHVLTLAGEAGISRVVNISSASAFGFAWSTRGVSPLRVPVTDDHPYVGDDVYGLSKQVGELVASTASRRYDMTVVSLRFPFIGAGERLARHLGPIHDDPGVDRSGLWAWLHTADAARAIAAALTAELSGPVALTVAAPDTTSREHTANLLRRYHPDSMIEREPAGFDTVFAVDRAYDLLGFRPERGWR